MKPNYPSEDELQAYVDGQLDAMRHAEIKALAAADAGLTGWIDRLRAENQQLRAALASLPPLKPEPRLDPVAIRRGLARRRQTRLAVAASVLLAFGLGGVGGWQGHGMVMQSTSLPMADAVQAYRLFSESGNPVVDIAAGEPGKLQNWLDMHFVHAAPMPDLKSYGFRPVGGRLMATEQGSAAMVLYRDDRGETVLFYIRPPGHTAIGRGSRREGDLLAQYWADQGYHYAVVSTGSSPRSAAVQRALDPLI